MKHIFIIGARGYKASYGGWETFVTKLVDNYNDENTIFHISGLSEDNDIREHKINNRIITDSFYIKQNGGMKMLLCTIKAFMYYLKYIKNNNIEDAYIYVLGLKLGPFLKLYKNKINKLAGLLRIKLGSELDLIDKNKYEFCIINDFPMYEYNEEENTWDFGHNPFSMPQGGLEALTEDNIENVVAYQYDFVCNGYEMASGAVRNHDIKIMKRAFELAGYTDEDVETKFRSLYTAFQYGAPPHAGMAPGIDRILMLLKDEENIREMVAFPLGANGADAMMGCPGEVFEKQLRETHIKVRD